MRRSPPPADASARSAGRWALGCAAAFALACGADDAPRGTAAMADAGPPVASPAAERALEDAVEELETPVPPPPSAPLPAAPAPAAAADVPAPETGATQAPATQETDARPLPDLLRLPAVTPVDRATERAADRLKVPPPTAPQEAADADSPESRLKVEYESRKEEVDILKRARTRTDAGVSVKTSEDTRLKTGVRVEQEEGLERESPVPTVGIEKRF